MYQADLAHDKPALQEKLERLYTLNRDKTVDLGFRPPYLDLLKAFGNPHQSLPPTIHVAGTNGKGSTIAMLRAIYEEAGYKVHAYTSPHLKRFNERIVLAGQEIDDEPLESLIDEALSHNEGRACTFFEITTAIAFAAFSRHPADVLLLETGLGGRLDCTNVIEKPLCTIITPIAYDHMEFLGDTLPQIAQEKAGIMKPDSPCIIAPQSGSQAAKEVTNTLTLHASKTGSPLYAHGSQWTFTAENNSIQYVFDQKTESFQSPNLLGLHQISNFATALTCIKVNQNHLPVHDDAIQTASKRIKWPGRLQRLDHMPGQKPPDASTEIWFDGGHNESAGEILGLQAHAWQQQDGKDLHLILAMKYDKDPQAFLKHLTPYTRSLTLLPLHGVGGCITKEQLEPLHMPNLHSANTVEQAVDRITAQNGTNLRILICGSLYLAEQVL